MIRCTIDYGYDIHHIDLDRKTYLAIKRGEKISVVGQGFCHECDGEVGDNWYFNETRVGEIEVHLDNGAELSAHNSWFDPAPAGAISAKPVEPRPRVDFMVAPGPFYPLRRLSALLRDPTRWPKNFEWDFSYIENGAIGLACKARLLVEVYEPAQANNLHFDLHWEEFEAIFCDNTTYGAACHEDVRPEQVADKIDEHLRAATGKEEK